MVHKWSLAAVTAVVLLATACSSKGGTSSAQGREHANEARKTTAEVYWKLYNSISAPAFSSGGNGVFTRCGKKGSTSASYVVRTIFGATSNKDVTSESLMQAVANQMDGLGWHLSPASGLERSATKGGITVELQPPSFGSSPMTTLQVQSECVDLGSAADSIIDGYYQHSDLYSGADASKSPVPTTFPSPN